MNIKEFHEWMASITFLVCASWLTWHLPALIVDWFPPGGSQTEKLIGLLERSDIAPSLPGLLGGKADIVDYLALLILPISGIWGVRTVQITSIEFNSLTLADRIGIFVGRLAMMMTTLLTLVMLYEVILRYVFEAPTIWANELSLWLACFIFLLSGYYVMQQRGHIRIFLLYDVCPRWLQHIFDCISTFLILMFAFFLVYGGYGEALTKLHRWETFGTAFNPPLPATVKPMILLVVILVALQSLINLIADWNAEPEAHGTATDIDEDEIERLRASLGVDEPSTEQQHPVPHKNTSPEVR